MVAAAVIFMLEAMVAVVLVPLSIDQIRLCQRVKAMAMAKMGTTMEMPMTMATTRRITKMI